MSTLCPDSVPMKPFPCFVATLILGVAAAAAQSPPRGYSIPTIDLSKETQRQVIVDREPGQYLGHVTTVLLEDEVSCA